ncbi:50S ribosomal protein L29 [Acidihalobacter ferrooxydans]|uniref:Large ribosomal subunit protein uL29 n=1 Tax=Acidihalobacter ferrooxydans TaxID=1765967 RepID=A0A1P8UJQ5_9GAMM|nr:50S ribosomal protein L29 [Acidihalobacter ferrooxydans]APZ44077.1 50S ribosomal protein L29 [Acidihalobacter ferrooxydans]
MNVAELREKSVTELQGELIELRRAQFNLRMQKGAGQLSKPDQVGKVRKDIARVKTVLSEKSRTGETA